MEKTAMQALIEQIEDEINLIKSDNRESRIVKGRYVDCLIMAKELLEQEKQQIIDAFVAGDERGTKEIPFNAEQYYSQTYTG